MQGAPTVYPELSDCVASVVRTMRFRRATKPTTVNIPFVFDARNRSERTARVVCDRRWRSLANSGLRQTPPSRALGRRS
jgi:hypothetical protein